MQNQPVNAQASGEPWMPLGRPKCNMLSKHFTKDVQRDQKGDKATWDLHQWSTNVYNEINLNKPRYDMKFDASLGFTAYADDKEDTSWIKQESEYGLLELPPSPSGSGFTHSPRSSDSAPHNFRTRAYRTIKPHIAANTLATGLEMPRLETPWTQRQQPIMGPRTKPLKRKRDDYDEDNFFGYSETETWTTCYPNSSGDEKSNSEMRKFRAVPSRALPRNKRRRCTTFVQPDRNCRSYPEGRLPGVKEILSGCERVQYNDPEDPFIFYWDWLMRDRDMVESLRIGL